MVLALVILSFSISIMLEACFGRSRVRAADAGQSAESAPLDLLLDIAGQHSILVCLMEPPNDFDGAWKEALEDFFEPFLQLCFPSVHAAVDWTKPWEFLNQELVDLIRDSALGRQQVDKLAKVILRTG